MNRAPLHDSRFKLNWANRHFKVFQQEVAVFFEANRAVMVTEPDGDAGGQVVKIKWPTPFPDEFAARIGDCLHNIRSALDHAVVELTGEKREGFSFYKSKDAFEKEISKGKYSGLSQQSRDIISAAQPYRGGNNILCGLDEARNVGTHRFLIPTATSFNQFSITGAIFYNAALIPNAVGSFDDGIPLVRIAPGEQFISSPGKENLQLGFGILFGEIEGIAHRDLNSTIIEMHKMVSEIVEQLAAQLKS